jgi:hypothetical protein
MDCKCNHLESREFLDWYYYTYHELCRCSMCLEAFCWAQADLRDFVKNNSQELKDALVEYERFLKLKNQQMYN